MKIHDIALSQLRNNEHFQFATDISHLLPTVPAAVATVARAANVFITFFMSYEL